MPFSFCRSLKSIRDHREKEIDALRWSFSERIKLFELSSDTKSAFVFIWSDRSRWISFSASHLIFVSSSISRTKTNKHIDSLRVRVQRCAHFLTFETRKRPKIVSFVVLVKKDEKIVGIGRSIGSTNRSENFAFRSFYRSADNERQLCRSITQTSNHSEDISFSLPTIRTSPKQKVTDRFRCFFRSNFNREKKISRKKSFSEFIHFTEHRKRNVVNSKRAARTSRRKFFSALQRRRRFPSVFFSEPFRQTERQNFNGSLPLISVMSCGYTLIESGGVRSQNAAHSLFKTFLVFS